MVIFILQNMIPTDKADLILEVLRQHDKRFEQIEKRFEQIDKRFDQIAQDRAQDRTEWKAARAEDRAETNRRFEQMDKRFDHLENLIERDKDKLEKVYESRDKVKITFGWQWGMASFFIAFVAVGFSRMVFPV